MGYAISWIAFKDKTSAQVVEMLGLSLSGEFEEIPEGKFSGTQLGTGWYVVVIDQYGHKYVRAGNLKRVSMMADVVAAMTEEHVMFTSAEAWKSGRLIWKVTHEGESGPLGPRHLEEQGSFPEQYGDIKARLLAAQQQEDPKEPEVDHICDIPLELAESIVGYKHDKALDSKFEILRPVGGGLLSRLFGKK